MPTIQFKSKFDMVLPCKETHPVRFDSLANHVNFCLIPNRPDIRSLLPFLLRNRFDSFRSGDTPQVSTNRFTAAALRTILVRNRLNILRLSGTGGVFSNRFDAVVLKNTILSNRCNSVNDYPNVVGRLTFRYDTNWSYLWKLSNRFQIVSDVVARICYSKIPARFAVEKSGTGFFPNRFDSIPQDFLAYFRNRFDSVGSGFTVFPARKQAFVLPGWRILAKNIENGEVFNLGFIDEESENPVLENVLLPGGDYEIHVLTSSLFWKDTLDTVIRTISIRPGEEISPLPTIYNLRSSISQGETTIYWSANRSEVSDCVFGVWYSSHSPVPTDRPPDATVWYSPDLTEYLTSFKQSAPCYVAVAALRTGNEPETGKIHELFLNWSNIPPRFPDDVTILDAPLPVYDPAILTIERENPDLSLWS